MVQVFQRARAGLETRTTTKPGRTQGSAPTKSHTSDYHRAQLNLPDHNTSPGKWRRLKLISLVALLIAFLFSVLANLLLLRQTTKSYSETSEIRLDPYALRHTFYDPAPATGDAPLAVFFGDSRAEQWPAPQGTQYRFVNRGIGGQTTEQVRGRFDAHVRPLNPKVIIVQAGINDLKTIALFPQRRNSILADCKANLHEIVRRATADGDLVILTTIFPTGPVSLVRRMQWSPEIDRAVAEVNEDLKSLASEKVIVFDAYSILQSDGHVPRDLAVDTLHMNSKAYEKLNGELGILLNKVQAGYPSKP